MSHTSLMKRVRALTLVLLGALAAWVLLWQAAHAETPAQYAWALASTLPLWLPVRGLLRGVRRTYAWATLCVIPYFILGVTESFAVPALRLWAGVCLLLALALFVALIAYLRITRHLR